jgi:hypothetical protein
MQRDKKRQISARNSQSFPKRLQATATHGRCANGDFASESLAW